MINFKLFFKGTAMGCADLIPGVSGGTIALITGIYEELINSINSIDAKALQLLLQLKIKELWQHVNGLFLIHVFAGMLISIFSLSGLFTYLLENHSIPLWSFFFGLILVSAFFVMPEKRNIQTFLFLILGVAAAYSVTSLNPSGTPDQFWFIFISGAIAICAMILPGISGSFILLLLAKYEYILSALKAFDIKVIITFGIGCIVGLLSFSKLIHWMLNNHKEVTMASLAGFMLGSLNKIWPWKEAGEMSFTNLSPSEYAEVTAKAGQLTLAATFCILGGVVVILLEYFGKTKK